MRIYHSYELNILLREVVSAAPDYGSYREGNDALPGEVGDGEVAQFTTSILAGTQYPVIGSQILIMGTSAGFAVVKSVVHALETDQVTVVAEIEVQGNGFVLESVVIEKYIENLDAVMAERVKGLVEGAEISE